MGTTTHTVSNSNGKQLVLDLYCNMYHQREFGSKFYDSGSFISLSATIIFKVEAEIHVSNILLPYLDLISGGHGWHQGGGQKYGGPYSHGKKVTSDIKIEFQYSILYLESFSK